MPFLLRSKTQNGWKRRLNSLTEYKWVTQSKLKIAKLPLNYFHLLTEQRCIGLHQLLALSFKQLQVFICYCVFAVYFYNLLIWYCSHHFALAIFRLLLYIAYMLIVLCNSVFMLLLYCCAKALNVFCEFKLLLCACAWVSKRLLIVFYRKWKRGNLIKPNYS